MIDTCTCMCICVHVRTVLQLRMYIYEYVYMNFVYYTFIFLFVDQDPVGPFTGYGCLERQALQPDFIAEEGVCYNLNDRATHERIERMPFYPNSRIHRMDASFCATDLCNVNDNSCANPTPNRDNPNPRRGRRAVGLFKIFGNKTNICFFLDNFIKFIYYFS